MSEIVFAQGIIFKGPRSGAPSFVKGSLSFKVDEAIEWLKANADNGWCNVDLKVSQQGKPYASLNTWKPNNDGSYKSSAKNVNNEYQNRAKDSMAKHGYNVSEEDITF